MPCTHPTRPRARRTTPPTDPEVIALASYKRIVRHAHRLLDRRLGHENAESIAVDVWLWLTERRVKEPGFLSTPKAFAEGIQRKIFDELRKVYRDLERCDESINVEEFVDFAGSDSFGGGVKRLTIPDEIFARSETTWHVQRAIAQLPFQMQRVIRYYDLEGWTAEEVAATPGSPPASPRQIRHKAKARLRELLEPFGGMKAA